MLLPSGARAEGGDAPRILVIGDSLLAWHSSSGRSVADRLEHLLGQPVQDRSVSAARMIYHLPISGAVGLAIPKQFRDGDWDWVVVNGGGNDLWLGCGCNRCDRKLNRLLSKSADKGAIHKLVSRIRDSGAKVLWLGYLRSPGFDTPIESCKDDGDILEARIATLAEAEGGVFFQSITDLVPPGDRSFHAADRIHPSMKASDAIARRLARVIRAN
ncbi:SGNH/GDSL hydrolase family protein [Aliiroseovarius subalbicans]|uniref:SGNH/GDSL hydrolase family protein n=1 Tax=Aliiroseovarius subalbicans TaxID=2925840 RepID=UPI001F5A6114|nr:SGNH/GDSL hydrolase family protein [Aliiroseovarius subalbicans]MCI2400717.1 SGNH/GDSL hydrolase family protein [Aliiroseovarius subalbicans]